jgi:EmrB/QacA subfamily drug resistance transporter
VAHAQNTNREAEVIISKASFDADGDDRSSATATTKAATTEPAPTTPSTPTLPNGKAVNPWLVLVSIIFGFFMALLDMTVINIALTNIQTDLKTDLSTVGWIIHAYILTLAALLVLAGRLADSFGRKRVFMGGMVIFSVGSLLCTIAPSIEFLIAFRALQAVGAAALEAISLAIIMAVFPRDKRAVAIGIWGALAGLAAAAGPVVGGVLLELGKGNLEWRWIFLVNLPFCVVGLFMIACNVPPLRDSSKANSIDLPGAVLLTTAMVSLILALTEGNSWGWTSLPVVSLFGLSAVSFGLFYLVENRHRQAQPILDFSLFKIRSFTAACLTIVMFAVAFEGSIIMLAQFFTLAKGQTPLDAAYSLMPLPLSIFVTSAISGAVAERISLKARVLIGLSIVGLGLLSLWTLTPDAGYFDTLWRQILTGIGFGSVLNSLPNIALSEVSRAKLGVGSGAFNTFNQFGVVLGAAILITLFTSLFQTNLDSAKIRLANELQTTQTIPAEAKPQILSAINSLSTRQSESNVSGSAVGNGNGITAPPASPFGQRIEAEVKGAGVDSFTTVWFAAAMFALFGLVPALFIKAGSHNSGVDPHSLPDDDDDSSENKTDKQVA